MQQKIECYCFLLLLLELSSGRGGFIWQVELNQSRASRRGEKWKDVRSKKKSFNTTKKTRAKESKYSDLSMNSAIMQKHQKERRTQQVNIGGDKSDIVACIRWLSCL